MTTNVVDAAAGEQARCELVANREPRAVERLGCIRRCRGRADFAPTVAVVGEDADEQRVLRCRGTERGAERPGERQPNAGELDRVNGARHDAGA